jgi:hypothetical protein
MNFPLMADDYIYAVQSFSPNFSLTNFPYLLVKRPLSSILDFIIFKIEKTHFSNGFFYLAFFLHSLGLMGIVKWLSDRMNPGLKAQVNSQKAGVPLESNLFAIVLCLYPCFHEVLFLKMDLPYALGTLFLSGMLYSTRSWAKIIFQFLAFSSLETYVVPALLLPFIPNFYRFLIHGRQRQTLQLKELTLKETTLKEPALTRKHLLVWGVALMLYLGVQVILSLAVAHLPYSVSFSWIHLLDKAKQHLSLLWTIHFYKEYWVATVFEWAGITGALLLFPGNGKVRRALLILLLFIPFAASTPALLLKYYAPRSIHGAAVLKLALVGCIIMGITRVSKKPLHKFAILLLLSCAYVSQSMVVFSVKAKNSQVLALKEKEWVQKMNTCSAPCTLSGGNLGLGLGKDWVLPPFSYPAFLEWVQLRNGIQKKIVFVE